MTKALIAAGMLLALFIGGLAYAVYASKDEGADAVAVDNILSEDITRAVATRDELDLGALTDFDWESVVIVERGTPDDVVAQWIETDWNGGVNFETGASDQLLFMNGTQIERFAEYRGEGRFEGIERPIAEYARDQAVFDVKSLVITPR